MKGWTLLELVLVIALLGILVSSFLPRLSPQTAGLDAAARKVRADIAYAQSLAMNRGVPHGVEFTAGVSYVVYRISPATPVSNPLTQQPFSEDLSEFRPTTMNTGYRVEFNSMGQPVIGGGGSVTLTNSGVSRVIDVSNTTGRATIR